MDRDREPGQTYALKDIMFFDFETRSRLDLKEVGAYRYATEADAIILAFAIGDDEPTVVAVESFDRPLAWDDMPSIIRAHHARVLAGTGIWCAWNVGFDRAVWNFSTIGFPELEPHHVIDAMAQAAVSGFAPDLATASRQAGGDRKLDIGNTLIKLFSNSDSNATPQSHREDWAAFCHYAKYDIYSMRDIFKVTRQLSLAEWKEFWTSEKINARGINIDLKMATHAAKLAEEDKRRSAIEIPKLTNGHVKTVNQVAKLSAWLRAKLPADGRNILVKREEEKEEDGTLTRPAKYALTKPRVEKLIAYCKATPGFEDQARVCELRYYGGSKSSAKFARMLQQHVDGKLYGSYVFSGAPQTGRYSSKGTQIHNLSRTVLPYEHEAIEVLLSGCSYDEFAKLGDQTPVARKLALLLRPAFVAPPGKMFVWSDWSQIEARILPYLSGNDSGALERLEIFREVDVYPKLPDLYVRTAAALSHVETFEVTEAMRQRGKIAELALGFAGAVGALQNMAASYDLYFSEAVARSIVDGWRDANQWAVDFWNRLWDAAEQAILYPGVPQRAGRIFYLMLEGSLLCVLPSRRVLTYRDIRYEEIEDLDDDDQPTGKFTTHLRFSRGYGRSKIWRGTLVENCVQSVAADFLRGTLCRLDAEGFDIVGHTHDEILLEVDEDQVDAVKNALREVMLRGFDWSRGLPLNSDEKTAPYYSKAKW